MKKKTIRKMALTLALMEVLSFGGIQEAEAEPYTYDGKLTIENVLPNQNILVSESAKYTIFDDETDKTFYAGNTINFISEVDQIIKSPKVWMELQKYYPVSEFASLDDAMDFYRIYYQIVMNSRSRYVAVVMRIFQAFHGKEKEFEEIFHQPMYKDGKLNVEIFTSDFFNSTDLENIPELRELLAKTFAEIDLERYVHSKEFTILPSYDGEPTNTETTAWFSKEKFRRTIYESLYNTWVNASDDYPNIALILARRYDPNKEKDKSDFSSILTFKLH